MAKIWNSGRTKKTQTEATPVQDTIVETKTETKVQAEPAADISVILKSLQKQIADQQAKIDKLEKWDENPFKSAKERYEWELHFSYKTWGWVPVLSYVSKKKNPARDLTFKNLHWEYESNHLLELSLANDTKIDVEVTEFNTSVERSPKMAALDQKGNVIDTDTKLSKVESFTFQDPEFGTIVVLPTAIN